MLLAKMRAGKSAAACDIHLDLDECIKSMQPSPPIAQGCLRIAILIRDAQEAVEHLSVVETTNGKWSTILTTLSLDTSSDSPLDPLTRRMRREAQNLNISVDDHLDMFDAQKHTGRIGPLHELLEFRWLPSGQAFWLLGRYKGRDCSMQVIAADDGHSLASREILEEEETLIAVPAHACPEIGVTIDKSSQSTLKVYNLATLQIRDRVELGHGRAGRASMYAKALKISSDGEQLAMYCFDDMASFISVGRLSGSIYTENFAVSPASLVASPSNGRAELCLVWQSTLAGELLEIIDYEAIKGAGGHVWTLLPHRQRLELLASQLRLCEAGTLPMAPGGHLMLHVCDSPNQTASTAFQIKGTVTSQVVYSWEVRKHELSERSLDAGAHASWSQPHPSHLPATCQPHAASQSCLICKASTAGRTFHLLSMHCAAGSFEWEVCNTKQLPDFCYPPVISPDARWAISTLTCPLSKTLPLVHCNLLDGLQHVVMKVPIKAVELEWLPAAKVNHKRMMYVFTSTSGPMTLVDVTQHSILCTWQMPTVSKLVPHVVDMQTAAAVLISSEVQPIQVTCLLDNSTIVDVHGGSVGVTIVIFR